MRTTVTQRIQPKDRNIPQFVKENPDHTYGVRSDLATNKAPTIAKIVNNDYLKEFLTDRIATKAIEATDRRANAAKRGRNRAFKFRSGSVMARVPMGVQRAEKDILKKAAMRAQGNSGLQTATNSQRSQPRAASMLDTVSPKISNALEFDSGNGQPITSERM